MASDTLRGMAEIAELGWALSAWYTPASPHLKAGFVLGVRNENGCSYSAWSEDFGEAFAKLRAFTRDFVAATAEHAEPQIGSRDAST